MIIICVGIDILGVLGTVLDALFGAGEFIKFFINFVASWSLYFWATLKGVPSSWIIAGDVLELVPFVNALPFYTVAMATTIYLDRHPKEAEAVQKVSLRIVNPKRITPTTNAVKKTTPNGITRKSPI